jgi:transposase
MRAYGIDLRERATRAVENGACTVAEAAARFDVVQRSLERWLQRKRTTGSCAPKPPNGGRKRKLAAAEVVIRQTVSAQPDVTLQELCERVERKQGLRSSPSMMCRELAYLKLPLKKSRFMPANATRRG